MKIEKIAVKARVGNDRDFRELVKAILILKPGESFFTQRFSSNARMAISILQIEHTERRYASRREKDGFRVGRVR